VSLVKKNYKKLSVLKCYRLRSGQEVLRLLFQLYFMSRMEMH